MAGQFKVLYNGTTKAVLCVHSNAVIPEGFVEAGTGEQHFEGEDTVNANHNNHVLYHHVQNALYKIGITNMQSISITVDMTPPEETNPDPEPAG